MTSPSDIADLLRPGAIVPVDPQTTQRLVQALRSALASPSDKQTGGPAFPFVCDADFDYGTGMTLRDYFAAKALAGMMSSRDPRSPRFHPEDDAAYVYAVADAMLKARNAAQ